MEIPVVQVDAFTPEAFAGNPAAVCPPVGLDCSAARMQQIAAEMNLSETAFLTGRDDGGFDLRWFTPTTEVELCGHATLAAAYVLWERQRLSAKQPAVFHTRSGRLTARRREGGWIWMDFPAQPARPADAPPGLASALDLVPAAVRATPSDLLVVVEDQAQVRGLQPDLARLGRLPVRGVIVTAAAGRGDDHDFVSRFFAPGVGIPEDPVTGSAHCALGPYWAERLGRHALTGYQASARGGSVRVELAGDRVRLGGQAVTVLRGSLLVA